MNKLTGTIRQIQTSGAIMLVDIDVEGHGFSAMLIESALHPEWLVVGNAVDVVFKETEVSLGKNITGKISLRNRMKGVVEKITRGELLSMVSVSFKGYSITSAITTRAVDSLEIVVGEEIEAMVKSNEISLMKRK